MRIRRYPCVEYPCVDLTRSVRKYTVDTLILPRNPGSIEHDQQSSKRCFLMNIQALSRSAPTREHDRQFPELCFFMNIRALPRFVPTRVRTNANPASCSRSVCCKPHVLDCFFRLHPFCRGARVLLGGSPEDGAPSASLGVRGYPMNSGTHSVVLVGFLSYVTRSAEQREVDMNLRENTVLLPPGIR